MMRRHLTNLFTLKAADYDNRGMPALKVSELFFVSGYISACGDALLVLLHPLLLRMMYKISQSSVMKKMSDINKAKI